MGKDTKNKNPFAEKSSAKKLWKMFRKQVFKGKGGSEYPVVREPHLNWKDRLSCEEYYF